MLMSQILTHVLLLANRANRTQSVSDLIGYEQMFLPIKVENSLLESKTTLLMWL